MGIKRFSLGALALNRVVRDTEIIGKIGDDRSFLCICEKTHHKKFGKIQSSNKKQEG